MGSAALAHNPINVARTADGQLIDHIHAIQPEPLNPSIFPEYPGWCDFDVAVEALDKDDLKEGLFTLDSASDIDLILVASDPGVRVAFASAEFLEVGSAYNLGHPYFHYHPAWNIYDGVVGEVYEMTFKLHDRSGIYTDSEAFSVTFTPVPAPATIALLGAFAVSARRRR